MPNLSAHKEYHNRYYQNSPYYRNLFDRWGEYLNTAQASLVAGEHGTSLSELGIDFQDDLCLTVDLVMALGY